MKELIIEHLRAQHTSASAQIRKYDHNLQAIPEKNLEQILINSRQNF